MDIDISVYNNNRFIYSWSDFGSVDRVGNAMTDTIAFKARQWK